ncbi:MAG: hexosaminidase [Micromonosporaceae bacterium]|jgi:hexosaminidase|nr:hexosaminidase [Micromonosporaceae bacterium]
MGTAGRISSSFAALLAAGTAIAAVSSPLAASAATLAATSAPAAATGASPLIASLQNVVPAPVTVRPARGVRFALGPSAKIFAVPTADGVAGYLVDILRRSTGYSLPVMPAPAGSPMPGISLLLTGADPRVGAEGYQLDVTAATVVLRAQTPAGLFAGVQTLRQLLPGSIERSTPQAGPWTIPGGTIIDYPRFAYRGAMLDVARHFFDVSAVERYIDQLAQYKINFFHLHLADDQGWRIAIDSWPRLTTVGGSTQVGGGPGGFYTKADYRAIVAYAQARFITVVPEIDMPGHVNAALASYADLTCDGVAPPLYTGTAVGFSSLCTSKAITYRFVDDVVGEIAALTPGPYVHIGGDEASATNAADYAMFMNRAQQIVANHGKTVLAWHQVVGATPLPSTVAQFWGTTSDAPTVAAAAARGTKILMSPANRSYLDMKYTAATVLGQTWAGLIEVMDAYNWDPATIVNGVGASAVRGAEAPLWTETIRTSADIEFMAFPRLPAIAELVWSPAATHNWTAFRTRLGAQAPRWTAQNINFYRSPQVAWAAS